MLSRKQFNREGQSTVSFRSLAEVMIHSSLLRVDIASHAAALSVVTGVRTTIMRSVVLNMEWEVHGDA